MPNLIWIHCLRACAMLMVVLLHSAAPTLYRFKGPSDTYWMIGNFYDSFVRVCVPLFFMISGFLLLNKTESTSNFINKRLKKIIIPTLFWTLIYLTWKILYEKQKLDLGHSLFSALISPSYYHLWFVYATIGLYLAVPILRKFVTNTTNSNIVYFLSIWFFCAAILPLIEKTLGTKAKYDLGIFTGYAGYLILGLFLGRFTYKSSHAIISVATIIAGLLITAFGTYFLTLEKGSFVDKFYGYLSPAIILSAAAWFVLFKYIFQDKGFSINTHIEKSITSLSSLSFGIYLVHALYLTALKSGAFGFKVSALSGNPAIWIPITAFLVFSLSYATVWTLSKIPFLRKTI